MKYQELEPLSQEQAERNFSGNDDALIAKTLFRLNRSVVDAIWLHSQAVRFSSHPNGNVRRAAALTFGYLALHRRCLIAQVSLPILQRLIDDPEAGGAARDAYDDLEMAMSRKASQA